MSFRSKCKSKWEVIRGGYFRSRVCSALKYVLVVLRGEGGGFRFCAKIRWGTINDDGQAIQDARHDSLGTRISAVVGMSVRNAQNGNDVKS